MYVIYARVCVCVRACLGGVIVTQFFFLNLVELTVVTLRIMIFMDLRCLFRVVETFRMLYNLSESIIALRVQGYLSSMEAISVNKRVVYLSYTSFRAYYSLLSSVPQAKSTVRCKCVVSF